MEYINGIYSMSLGKCSTKDDAEYESKLELLLNGNKNSNKTKHARDLIPSINQQVKIGNLLSTLRPNQ